MVGSTPCRCVRIVSADDSSSIIVGMDFGLSERNGNVCGTLKRERMERNGSIILRITFVREEVDSMND